jgi:hypothetical protein
MLDFATLRYHAAESLLAAKEASQKASAVPWVELVRSEDRAAEDHDEIASAALNCDHQRQRYQTIWSRCCCGYFCSFKLFSVPAPQSHGKTGTEILLKRFCNAQWRGAHANQGSDVYPASTADFRPPRSGEEGRCHLRLFAQMARQSERAAGAGHKNHQGSTRSPRSFR